MTNPPELLTDADREALDRIVHNQPFQSDDARLDALCSVVERIVRARRAHHILEGWVRGWDSRAAGERRDPPALPPCDSSCGPERHTPGCHQEIYDPHPYRDEEPNA